jgi:hypothetical protein
VIKICGFFRERMRELLALLSINGAHVKHERVVARPNLVRDAVTVYYVSGRGWRCIASFVLTDVISRKLSSLVDIDNR